jgi:uncharacterized phiE125 gp8 family phage protein
MIKLVKKPGIPVLNVHEVKHSLRIDHSFDDAVIEGTIGAATATVESYINRSLLSKIYECTWECRNDQVQSIPLSYPPIVAIEKIVEIFHEFDQQNCRRFRFIQGETPMVEVYSKAPRIQLTYKAGYGDYPSDIDDALKRAVLIASMELYDKPDTFSIEHHPTLSSLLSPYKVMRLM